MGRWSGSYYSPSQRRHPLRTPTTAPMAGISATLVTALSASCSVDSKRGSPMRMLQSSVPSTRAGWSIWTRDHSGAQISWYDWMRNEPNDWRGQNCLTYLKDQDIFGHGVYHWNDWDCNDYARFICE